MELRRWTPFTFLFPWRYVHADEAWREFDLVEWPQSEYEWTEDDQNGFSDFTQRPASAQCVFRGRGDCEDYALVAVSQGIVNGRDGVGIAFCWRFPYPWPTHVVTFDDKHVFSSGRIAATSLKRWIKHSNYSFAVPRRIT